MLISQEDIMAKRHVVELTDDERAALEQQEAGPLTRRQRYRAQILLRADAGDSDEEIAGEAGVSIGTVANVRRRFAAGGIDTALNDRPRPGAAPVLDGKAEAIVIATACSPVPEGRAKWTARTLANRLVELQVVEGVSEDTILRVLKKVTSSPGRRSRGACPRA
jgi:transposase